MSGRSEQIAATICEAILAHQLVPGAKLGERELADFFSVSRIVIRQALIRLAEDELVTLERNRGAFVAKPSLAEAIEVFETLTMLEQGVIGAKTTPKTAAFGVSDATYVLLGNKNGLAGLQLSH